MAVARQSMELAEVSQRLAFLDVERRKDKELVATLLERLETQHTKLESQARQIQELEGLLASTRAKLAKISQVENAMGQLRQELSHLIENNELRRDKAYRELNRLREVEQEALGRQVNEVRKELKAIPPYHEDIDAIRSESGRQYGLITTLQHQLAKLDKRLEDRMQTIIYLEEQRNQDTQRITQVESRLPDLSKRIEEFSDKFPPIERAIQLKNQDIERAAELLEQQSQIIENQRVSEFRWERKVAEWADLVEEIKRETASMTSQTVRLREQHEQVRRALADLPTFRERIEKRQDEMAEKQRMAESRQKRVMEEWQIEREKEWKRFKAGNEEQWREDARLNEKRSDRIKAIEDYLPSLVPQIEALWEVHEAWSQSIMVGPREWIATWDEILQERPNMPQAFKAVEPVPVQMPKIRPLPSLQENENTKEG